MLTIVASNPSIIISFYFGFVSGGPPSIGGAFNTFIFIGFWILVSFYMGSINEKYFAIFIALYWRFLALIYVLAINFTDSSYKSSVPKLCFSFFLYKGINFTFESYCELSLIPFPRLIGPKIWSKALIRICLSGI